MDYPYQNNSKVSKIKTTRLGLEATDIDRMSAADEVIDDDDDEDDIFSHYVNVDDDSNQRISNVKTTGLTVDDYKEMSYESVHERNGTTKTG